MHVLGPKNHTTGHCRVAPPWECAASFIDAAMASAIVCRHRRAASVLCRRETDVRVQRCPVAAHMATV